MWACSLVRAMWDSNRTWGISKLPVEHNDYIFILMLWSFLFFKHIFTKLHFYTCLHWFKMTTLYLTIICELVRISCAETKLTFANSKIFSQYFGILTWYVSLCTHVPAFRYAHSMSGYDINLKTQSVWVNDDLKCTYQEKWYNRQHVEESVDSV